MASSPSAEKPTGMDHKQTTPGKRNYSGLDLEKNISPSGRGETFFLTFLFIELIDPWSTRFFANDGPGRPVPGGAIRVRGQNRSNYHVTSLAAHPMSRAESGYEKGETQGFIKTCVDAQTNLPS
jgi:hypothetical protein